MSSVPPTVDASTSCGDAANEQMALPGARAQPRRAGLDVEVAVHRLDVERAQRSRVMRMRPRHGVEPPGDIARRDVGGGRLERRLSRVADSRRRGGRGFDESPGVRGRRSTFCRRPRDPPKRRNPSLLAVAANDDRIAIPADEPDRAGRMEDVERRRWFERRAGEHRAVGDGDCAIAAGAAQTAARQ